MDTHQHLQKFEENNYQLPKSYKSISEPSTGNNAYEIYNLNPEEILSFMEQSDDSESDEDEISQ